MTGIVYRSRHISKQWKTRKERFVPIIDLTKISEEAKIPRAWLRIRVSYEDADFSGAVIKFNSMHDASFELPWNIGE